MKQCMSVFVHLPISYISPLRGLTENGLLALKRISTSYIAVSQYHFLIKQMNFLDKLLIPGLWLKKYKMSQEHLIVPESKDSL